MTLTKCDSCRYSSEQNGEHCYECVKGMNNNFEPFKDCRNCKKWDDCPCGKKGHESGTSQGYSIGECKDYEPCEESINKDELYKALDELNTICGTGMVEKAVTENNINWLKWKIDKLLSDALKEAYVRGYDYGVKDWFKAKTEPCEDAISREAVRQLIEADKVDMKAPYIDSVATDVQKMCFDTLNQACDRHIKGINSLPSVTSQPKRGEWISIDATHSKCEICEAIFEITSPNAEVNFCPNCGADVRESEDAE